jgi:hypothetical protein
MGFNGALSMKQNRSSVYTIGLCNTFENFKKIRTFFFELDVSNKDQFNAVCDLYKQQKLDYLVHKTGSGGYHFLSPTIITKERWSRLIKAVREFNRDCPMLCLRVKPNKYPNEDQIWYRVETYQKFENERYNSREMSNYLNKIWGTHFIGNVETELKIVNYPLPISEFCK